MKELTLGQKTFKDIIESNCLYIDKIVDTYQYRIEEDMYSRLFSMKKIKKNAYNLNISSYVSVSKEEEKINLDLIKTSLVDLEKKISKVSNLHNRFLKELGLSELHYI